MRLTLFVMIMFIPLLGACAASPVVINDAEGKCSHPYVPKEPLDGKKAAKFIWAQYYAIEDCRALLGH